jgi:hypothetical protein
MRKKEREKKLSKIIEPESKKPSKPGLTPRSKELQKQFRSRVSTAKKP